MGRTFLKLHLSVFLAGFTGLFGKLISLNEGLLVCYRMLFAALLLFPVLWMQGKLERVPRGGWLKMYGVGCLLALHWVFFYGSIKYANVSIGVICFSLTGFFTAVLEPLLSRRKISCKELLFSLIIVCGILLIFRFDTRYRIGILLGGISSALCTLFTIANKKIAMRYPAAIILLHEMTGGFLSLLCLMPFYLYYFPVESILPGAEDLLWLFVLAFLCTIGLYLLQIDVLKSVSAFTLNLSYNLEPVYSILFAMLFFGESKALNYAFYAGLGLILLSVSLQTYDSFRTHSQ